MANETYTLADAVARNRENPDRFHIPLAGERETLMPGDMAKVVFESGEDGERMWVEVTTTDPNAELPYEGPLRNNPTCTPLEFGEIVEFGPEHVIDIVRGEA